MLEWTNKTNQISNKKEANMIEKKFHLEFGKNTPMISETVNALQQLSNHFGIPFKGTEMEKKKKKCYDKTVEFDTKLKNMYQRRTGEECNYIDYTARKIKDSHIANITCTFLGIDDARYRNNAKYTYSFKKSDIEYLYNKNLEDLEHSVGKQREHIKENVEFLKALQDYNEASYILSSSLQLVDAKNEYEKKVVEFYKSKGENGETFEDFKHNLRDPELFYVYPKFQEAETGRITTQQPNIQGKTEEIKELITAPKGYKIASMDLKGQEVHILIWGILENPAIKEKYIQYGEPYRAILETAGFEYDEELKKHTKAIILGIMNGKKRSTMLGEMENKELANKVYDLIANDKGYLSKVDNYVNLNKNSSNPMRKGLFGTEKPANTRNLRYKSSLENQLRNGFFQLTASEIVSLSLAGFLTEIQKNPKYTFEDIRILVPIYDEFVIIFKEEIEDEAMELFETYFKPYVNDWPRFLGNPKVGDHYRAK